MSENGKRESAVGIKLSNQEIILILSEKEHYKYLEILEVDTIRMNEKNKNGVLQKNKNTSQNKTLKQKHHQMDKHLGNYPCNLHWAILKNKQQWNS